jgi:hypothetical protein
MSSSSSSGSDLEETCDCETNPLGTLGVWKGGKPRDVKTLQRHRVNRGLCTFDLHALVSSVRGGRGVVRRDPFPPLLILHNARVNLKTVAQEMQDLSVAHVRQVVELIHAGDPNAVTAKLAVLRLLEVDSDG